VGRRWGAICLAVVTAALAATPAWSASNTTVQRTIQDTDGDNLLDSAPGEDYTVLGAPSDYRPSRHGSLLNFLQLSDFQTVDEESPGRVEFLDTTQRAPGLNPFSAAYRPQESLSTQIVASMVKQARNTSSPITGSKLDLTMLTGDNADSQQFNETRWFIDMLDGTTGSGDPDPEMDPSNGGHKIDPDSGVPSQVSACDLPAGMSYQDNGSPYDGVRGGGRRGTDTGYYEPDSSSGAKDDGDGYSPDRARNREEIPDPSGTFGDVTVRDFPGLLEAAQDPFESVGLGMPWYTAFGNHDALVQGNSGEAFAGPFGPGDALVPAATETVNPAYDALVRGCIKPSKLPDGVTKEQVQGFLTDPSAFTADNATVVPPDQRRCHLAKDVPNNAAAPCDSGGWIQQHSRTTGFPSGHGFTSFSGDGQSGAGRPPEAIRNHDGYYSFKPRPGLRFIVLDTITDECGVPVCSEGSIDDTQFKWLERELDAAASADPGEYVLVFSHHTERTIRLESTDVSERPIHYGERVDRKGNQPVRPEAAPGTTLEDLLCRHSNVLGHVDGHEHQNYVLEHQCQDDGQAQNPYYEISTSAHIDFPQQSRMIELVKDPDGKLSLVLTMIDHDGAPNPGGPNAPADGQGNSGDSVQRLSSIGRELAYNDYQGSRGARGGPADRNVIIRTTKAFPYSPSP
jgi:hypothetical protein